jgi:hypothetical protein
MESESDESGSEESESEFLTFYDLCFALQYNDPDCTEAAVIWDLPRYEFGDYNDFCPCGYGSQLGHKLLMGMSLCRRSN